MAETIAIERVDHIGIRALAFYRVFGFVLVRRAEGDHIAIIRNAHGVELNLVFNANSGDPAANVLRWTCRTNFPASPTSRCASRPSRQRLPRWRQAILRLPRDRSCFGECGQVSVFGRDPDRNVIELRGREQGVVEGVTRYVP